MKNLFFTAIMALFLLPAGANAQTATPAINQTQKEQRERIQQGVKNGELTVHEKRKLVREQRKIARDEARAKADGVVTPRERATIKAEQRKASAHIAREKHDAQERR